jgi:hypothetical protein
MSESSRREKAFLVLETLNHLFCVYMATSLKVPEFHIIFLIFIARVNKLNKTKEKKKTHPHKLVTIRVGYQS